MAYSININSPMFPLIFSPSACRINFVMCAKACVAAHQQWIQMVLALGTLLISLEETWISPEWPVECTIYRKHCPILETFLSRRVLFTAAQLGKNPEPCPCLCGKNSSLIPNSLPAPHFAAPRQKWRSEQCRKISEGDQICAVEDFCSAPFNSSPF